MTMPVPSPNGNATTLAALKERTKNLPPDTPLGFFSAGSFDLMQRAAIMLSKSTLVPPEYRELKEKKQKNQNGYYDIIMVENPNATSNCVLALNMAQKLGADPLMVMQNLYLIEGKPGWSSQFIIAAINACGKFSPLRFRITDDGEKEVEWTSKEWVNPPNGGKSYQIDKTHSAKVKMKTCVAFATEKATGDVLEGPEVSIDMAVKEGWFGKNGSKWQTMPDVMLRYRAASFFGKLYAPELLMGLQTVEEAQDAVITMEPGQDGAYEMTVDNLINQSAQQTEPEQPAEEKPEKKAASKRKPKAQAAEPAPEPQPEQETENAQAKAVTESAATQVQPEQASQPEPPKPAAPERSAPQQELQYECPRNGQMVGPSNCKTCSQKVGCPEYWPPEDQQSDYSQGGEDMQPDEETF